jgi:putative ABC transport system ATP-binding protein
MSPCQEKVILQTRNVTRKILKEESSLVTVNDVSYDFHKGGIYSIVGPSGAGKSSFLRLLNRLDEISSGEILFHNEPIQGFPPTELRKKLSMLFQSPYLFDGTVLDNLTFCCDNKEEELAEMLVKVGLKADFINKPVENISGGERQRVALARALLLEPEILLLDEPTAALDPSLSRTIEQLVLSLSRELCLTVIIITHETEQALRLGGETLLMVGGRLIENGSTEDVLKNPQTDLGKKFIARELQ